MIVYDLNGDEYNKDLAMRHIMTNYADDVGSVGKLRDIGDQLNFMYKSYGESAVDKWFITDNKDYIKAFKALIIKS